MADGSKIEWTDATWNPIVGCSVVSPGCTNCYAMRLAGTRLKHSPSRAGLTVDSKAGPVWNGEVRFMPEWLNQPLNWKRPRRIFACAHGDLFHEKVPDGWIAQVWNVMGQCPQHEFQILTKRPARMRDFVSRWADLAGEDLSDAKLVDGPRATRRAHPSGRGQLFAAMLGSMGSPPPGAAYPTFDWMGGQMWWPAVLPNVWLGVSVEDQIRADERIPYLLDTPAAVRFLSCEPLLGTINLTFPHIDWVIAGGESGPNARPMHPDWIRSVRDQCKAFDTPFFFKQWGEWREFNHGSLDTEIDADSWLGVSILACAVNPGFITRDGRFYYNRADLPEEISCRLMERVGKKKAGALLDGVEHRAEPRQTPGQTT